MAAAGDRGATCWSDSGLTRAAGLRGYGSGMSDSPAPDVARVSAPAAARLGPKHWVLVDWVVAVLLATLATLGWRELAGMPGPNALDAVLVAASTLPAGWRRRRPGAVLVVVTLAGTVTMARSAEPAPALAAVYVMYVIPLRFESRAAVRLLAGTVAVTVVGVLVLSPPPYQAPAHSPVPVLIGSVAGIGGAFTLGWASRQQRAHAAAERRLAEHRAAEAVERRLAEAQRVHDEERLQIARELHDVVAHAMSVIAVQAGVAHFVAADQPGEAVRALGSIEQMSRGALREMRALLGVLRNSGGLAPAPGLADLGDVVGRAAEAGVRVELMVRGRAVELPAGLELAAYRVVQEAVTNVIKHSGADSCQVQVEYGGDRLGVSVVDRGPGPGPGPGGGGVAAAGAEGGHGLVGMRERVGMYGGCFDAGPVPGGRGFRVTVVFPLTACESSEL